MLSRANRPLNEVNAAEAKIFPTLIHYLHLPSAALLGFMTACKSRFRK